MVIHLVAHVTLLLVIAFFILFAASKADGFVRTLGTVLGFWIILIAIVAVVAVATAPMYGGKLFGMDMHGWNGGWMHRGEQPSQLPTPAPGGH